MAKSQAGADRRAVVEQMRRDQQRQERRRGLLVLAAALAVGAVIIGFAVWQTLKAQSGGGQLASIGVPASDAGCQDVLARKAEGNNDHRPAGEKILYKNTPPADGPHWGNYLVGTELRKFYSPEDRPPVEQLVHSLEHGHTILWYDESVADDDEQLDDVEAIARTFPSATDPNDKFIAAPWTSEDGPGDFPKGTHLALTHWSMGGTNGNPEGQQGIWQFCGKVSGEAVADFMADYPYSDSPEPTAP